MTSAFKRALALLLYVLVLVGLSGGVLLALTGEAGLDVPESFVFPVLLLSFATVGMVVALRTDHRIGWLFLASSVLGTAWGLAQTYLVRALVEDLPGLEWVVWFQSATYFSWIASVVSLPLLWFPDGRSPSRRWNWVGWYVLFLALYAAFAPTVTSVYVLEPEATGLEEAVYVDNPFGFGLFDGASQSPLVGMIIVLVIVSTLLLPAWAIVSRFRRSRGVERQQLKWFAFAAGVAGLGLALFYVAEILAKGAPAWLDLVLTVALLAVAGLPVAAGLAIARYRLYDIDRLISRTITYGLLAGLLAAVYALLVFVMGTLLPLQDNSLAVASSTLAVAALFNPLRRRLKSAIDRRFFRRGYDATVIAERFASSIRDRVEMESLSTELLEVVQETMEPAGASVWIRADEVTG